MLVKKSRVARVAATPIIYATHASSSRTRPQTLQQARQTQTPPRSTASLFQPSQSRNQFQLNSLHINLKSTIKSTTITNIVLTTHIVHLLTIHSSYLTRHHRDTKTCIIQTPQRGSQYSIISHSKNHRNSISIS